MAKTFVYDVIHSSMRHNTTLKQLHVNGGVSHRRWNVADYYCFDVAAATRTNVIIDGKTEEKIVILIHSTRNTVDYPNYYRDG